MVIRIKVMVTTYLEGMACIDHSFIPMPSRISNSPKLTDPGSSSIQQIYTVPPQHRADLHFSGGDM